MRLEKVKTIGGKAAELGEKSVELSDCLRSFKDKSGQSFNVQEPISGRDSSVSDIITRIQAIVGILVESEPEERGSLVPLQALNQLEKGVVEAGNAINGVVTSVNNIMKNEGGLDSFNYKNFHVHTGSGSNQNLQAPFHTLFDASEALLQHFFNVVRIWQPKGSYAFQVAASNLSVIIGEANENLRKTESDLRAAKAAGKKLAEQDEEAAAHLEEITRQRSEAASDRKTVSDYLAEVTQQKASIESVHEAATSLQADVKAYQSSFEQFQKQLDAREKAFEDGTESLSKLIEEFEQQRDGVATLLERSDQMLSSATVSGLAANFSNMMQKLTTELWWARAAFYVGIVFLTISAIPLLAFVLLPVVAPFVGDFSPEVLSVVMQYAPGSAENGWQYLGQVLARIAILLPAGWFVSFAAFRHSSLFRLREHYAYKYSMAVAVEGFKKQAPSYDEEIAALVLEQLAFNPADKLGSTKDSRESGAPRIATYLIDKIRGRVESAQARTEN